MYQAGTVLTLKDQRDADKETGEAFPYNKVEVIGESPIQHSSRGEWQGGNATGVLITPLSNHGGVIDEPFGKLRELYDVETIPEDVIDNAPIRVINQGTAQAGPTPEEVFAVKAPGKPPEEGQTRARTSPLGEDPRPTSSSPLDKGKPARGRKPADA